MAAVDVDVETVDVVDASVDVVVLGVEVEVVELATRMDPLKPKKPFKT